MSKTIAYRVTRLINSSVHALMNKFENIAPEMIMEQSIVEIDQAMDELRHNLGEVIASKHLTCKRLSQYNERHEALADEIECAIAKNREDLAHAAVSAQLDIEAQIPLLEKAMSDGIHSEKELESYLGALDAKKREMRLELNDLIQMKKESSSTSPNSESCTLTSDKAQNAISHFNAIMEKQTGVNLRHDPKHTRKLHELSELSRENRIQERIEAIKSTMSHDAHGVT